MSRLPTEAVVHSYAHGLILSPMAGITDRPYRMLCRKYGAEVTFTEMVSADGLLRSSGRTFRYLASDESDRPFGVQLLGSQPADLAAAAELVQEHADPDIIDINMGCPVPKVTRSGAGSAMMKDENRIREVLIALRKAVNRPLTLKMRAGWGDGLVNADRVLAIAADAGVDGATIHTRTRAQRYSGAADWDLYWQLKANTKVPLVANGDVTSAASYGEKTARDRSIGVMIARGAIGNPYVFDEIQRYRRGEPAVHVPVATIKADMIWLARETEATEGPGGIRKLRRVLIAFARLFPRSRELKMRMSQVSSTKELESLLDGWGE